MKSIKLFEQTELLLYVGKWTSLSTVVAVIVGATTTFFLFALDWATNSRDSYRWLIWMLPGAGFLVGWLYLQFGRHVDSGINLLIDEIYDPKTFVPLRMAPLALGSTVVSHLFGASVGREGTAVQIGGALADQVTKLLRLGQESRRIVLMVGISAGFASVFGTPLAGAIWSLEVLAIGRLRYNALLPCMVSATVADQVGTMLGAHHTVYLIPTIPQLSIWGTVAMILAGGVFGLTGKLFAEATHAVSRQMKKSIPYAPLRPFIGGLFVAGTVMFFGADRYIGLGVPTIVEAFEKPLPSYDFAAKMLFTIASVGSGFKGGEVTPLFYIGATLGNALAPVLHMPYPLLAGIGFVAVFAGATNTPVASTLMAMELFGAEAGVYAGVACVVSYLFSGQTSIYHSQRFVQAKHGHATENMMLEADGAVKHPAPEMSSIDDSDGTCRDKVR